MTKKEAVEFLKIKLDEGYITHSTLLEIYDDNEEVPKEFLDMCWKPIEQKPFVIFTSRRGEEYFNNMINKICDGKMGERT